MKETAVRILCPNGIHISPAGVMAKLLRPLSAKVEICRGEARANAADIDEVLALALREGEEVTVCADGGDAEKATEIVCAILREGTRMLAHFHPSSSAGEKKDIPADVLPGVSIRIGRIRQIADDLSEHLSSYKKGTPMEEARRFGEAVKDFGLRMEAASQSSARSGEIRQQRILEGYRMMADAPGFHAEVGRAINEGVSAPEAVLAAKEKMAETMLLKERAGDQREIGRSLARILMGIPEMKDFDDGTPLILVGDEISPEQMARFPGDRLAGIVESGGSSSGHAAILARIRGIPTILGYKGAESLPDGEIAIIDGTKGTIVVHPSDDELRVAQEKIEKEREEARRLLEETGAVATKDGVTVTLRANVGSAKEIEGAMKIGAEGVGLFRSEFLYLGRNELPTEDEQAAAYVNAVKACGKFPCVIRTLDAGGDKDIPALHLPKETNPFLGLRAIRISLAHPELLATQIRAVLRAAKEGNAAMLLPMIVSVAEVDAVREALDRERTNLFGDDKSVPRVPLGVMIETPAAVLSAETLAKRADFFSVGTNDLIQYTLAADRTNAALSHLDGAFHPAVLRLLKMTVDAANKAKIPVAVCGEMAAEPVAVPLLLGLGIKILSLAPAMLPKIRAVVRKTSFASARNLAEDALKAETAAEVRALTEAATL